MSRSQSILFLLRSLFFLFLWVKAAAPATAQDSKPAINLGLRTHYGFIIPHSDAIREVSYSHPRALELDLSLHFTSKKAWQFIQGYPRFGASVSYINFDNPDVLGNAYALILYVEPFLSAHRRVSLSFRFGGGLSYQSNVYDAISNPQNQFYSTRLAFPLTVNLMANYRLSETWLLRAGGTYSHISNGGIRQPNKGINFPMATLGVDYALRPATFPERQLQKYEPEDTERYYLVALSGTMKDGRIDQTDKLLLWGVTAYASQRTGRLSALTAGAEWVADYSIKEVMDEEDIDKDFQRGALLVGHELYIGRFRFNQMLGVYLYAPRKARDPVYQRWGLEYHTPPGLFFGINLKAHRHVADFLDVRVGWRFGN
ncbi:acyloxyacyl hydrolase [Pontibacter korlensis]|uniref:Lipid A 3-O-deacylase n=1 Tax=Pontibacter korlensis TaxID=400092 RepID=A0A0E3UZG6_9BACT|nr:acyloxyacyl hydrolase [Pontibacter korlensis]AKD05316.1 lipid A 3-O-deacylase [Pontibacter korlensis]